MTYAGSSYAGGMYAGFHLSLGEPPGQPENLAAVANSNNTITATWEPPTSGEDPATYYQVRVDGGTIVTLGDVLTYTTGGVTADATHTVEVRACNDEGCSDWVSVTVTTYATLVACPCGNPVGT